MHYKKTINASFDYINETSIYIIASFVFINATFIYRLHLMKSKFTYWLIGSLPIIKRKFVINEREGS